jgi:hypothetical protein
MHRVVVGLLLAIALVPVTAQRPTRPPTFEPGDTDGLVTSPNPRIRHAWKRRVFGSSGEGFWVIDARTLDYFDLLGDDAPVRSRRPSAPSQRIARRPTIASPATNRSWPR